MKRLCSVLFVLLVVQGTLIPASSAGVTPPGDETKCEETFGSSKGRMLSLRDAASTLPTLSFWGKVKSVFLGAASDAKSLFPKAELQDASLEEGQNENAHLFETPEILNSHLESSGGKHSLFLEALVKAFQYQWDKVPAWVLEQKHFALNDQDIEWIVRTTKNPKEFIKSPLGRSLAVPEAGLYNKTAVRIWIEREIASVDLDKDVFQFASYVAHDKARLPLAQRYLESLWVHGRIGLGVRALMQDMGLTENEAFALAVPFDLESAADKFTRHGRPQTVGQFEVALNELCDITEKFIRENEIQWLRQIDVPDVTVWSGLMRVKAQIEQRAGEYKFYADPLEVLSIGSGLPYERLASLDLSDRDDRIAFYNSILEGIYDVGFQSVHGWSEEHVRKYLLDHRAP